MASLRVYYRLLKKGFTRRDLQNAMEYGWDDAPRAFETIWIDPKAVNYCYTDFMRRETAMVIDGDWDLGGRALTEHPKLIACKEHYKDGAEWPDTGIYEYLMERIRRHGVFDGCRSLEDIEDRYRHMDALYEQLRADGRLKTQAELEKHPSREKGGIHIHINRHGEPVFGGGGCHRLAMARLLGFEKVPAQLGVVHPEAVKQGVMPKLRQH